MKRKIETYRLVLADDDEDDRELFHEALKKLNTDFIFSAFPNGKKLVDHLKSPDTDLPDIVFLDLNMPIMDGMETLIAIRRDERLRSLPIAIYSTSTRQDDIEQTLANGANVYISKPTDFSKLKEVLGKVLEMNWQFKSNGLNMEHYYLSF